MIPVFRAAGGAALLLLTLLASRAGAQSDDPWDAGRTQLTRAGLQELLARYEETSASADHTAEFRARARYEAALVRTRLREGDFQVGDQVILKVEGEAALSDTFLVSPQRGLNLPAIGTISLVGVLRSELEPHLTEQLKLFIKDPVVHANSSIRVLISGEVAKPGFYVFDMHSLLSDALMTAGGPTPTAKLTDVRVERGGVVIWEGLALQQAIAEGRTMDELSLRAGDHLFVPVARPAGMSGLARTLLAGVPAVALTITTLSRIFSGK
jgi:protein involved in polysaccharide export with SLBB domain